MSAMSTSTLTESPQLAAYKEKAMKDFEQARELLQQKRLQAQAEYVDPAATFVRQRAQSRPIQTALVGIFVGLGFFPALAFALFASSVVAIVGGSALIFALFVSLSVISGAAIVLLFTLALCAAASLTAVFWATVAFASYRFVLSLIHAETLVDGIKAFELEVKEYVKQSSPVKIAIEKDGESVAVGVALESNSTPEEEDVKVEGA